jgi:vacuolar-type H+-ATPase subunit H
MPQTIEDTVKALTEFEANLDRVKSEVLEAKKKMVKDAADWAESARSSAIAEAQKLATQRLAEARREAEAEATEIRKKGQASTRKFEESISKHKKEAAELVLRRLLGEGQ